MRAINNRKKPQVKKAANAPKQGDEDPTAGDGVLPAGGTQPQTAGDKKDQYDDKFYDLDDGWICDDDLGNNDDEVGEFIHESESQSLVNASAMRDSIANTVDEELK